MQNMIDSVLALPPDTITKEVIIVKDSTIYVTTVIDSPKPEDVVQQYTDSIINDSIDLRVNILATKLFKINYEYKPIYKYQETVIEKKVPHYIETIKEIEVTKRQLYYGFGLAYGNSFGIKTGLLYTTKKNYALQYDYTLLDSHKFHSFTYFIKF
ncbi:hypothetical protein [Tenacibaculum sp.]|uniref:hypothetical protein n=1 Tax=Tenacibaculum sp. TaxID=1906242 RepID=UPI003D10C2A8